MANINIKKEKDQHIFWRFAQHFYTFTISPFQFEESQSHFIFLSQNKTIYINNMLLLVGITKHDIVGTEN